MGSKLLLNQEELIMFFIHEIYYARGTLPAVPDCLRAPTIRELQQLRQSTFSPYLIN
jgi:hypothetical protein